MKKIIIRVILIAIFLIVLGLIIFYSRKYTIKEMLEKDIGGNINKVVFYKDKENGITLDKEDLLKAIGNIKIKRSMPLDNTLLATIWYGHQYALKEWYYIYDDNDEIMCECSFSYPIIAFFPTEKKVIIVEINNMKQNGEDKKSYNRYIIVE